MFSLTFTVQLDYLFIFVASIFLQHRKYLVFFPQLIKALMKKYCQCAQIVIQSYALLFIWCQTYETELKKENK